MTFFEIQILVLTGSQQVGHRRRSKPAHGDLVGNINLFARIDRDLEPWQEGISLDMVERTYCTVSSLDFQNQDNDSKQDKQAFVRECFALSFGNLA